MNDMMTDEEPGKRIYGFCVLCDKRTWNQIQSDGSMSICCAKCRRKMESDIGGRR